VKELSECRILIVDDVKANVDVLVEALQTDHKLSVALDGEAALRSVAKNRPDLVLLDIVMPGIDGYEVCRRLRAAPATREIPVMFLSSLEEVKNKTLGFEVGGNDYLTKPFEILEVKARVRSLLKAKAYSDAVKEKMAAELAIARQIQLGILPSDIAASVDGTGLEVSATLEPAREVGGDLYEVLRLDDGRLFVAVGDVSGKGVPAALFMAVATTLLRTIAQHVPQPQEIIQRVNEALLLHNPSGMFVTLVCLIIDPTSGAVICGNAAHTTAMLLHPGQPPARTLSSTGTLVGILPDVGAKNVTLTLQPGESLVLYTDGVTEAFDAAGKMFDEDHLFQHLAQASGRSAADTTRGVLDAVRVHCGDHPQSDDITIVTIRRSAATCGST
jgi:sigma-B regulation protein RsbU (phosphoserine phosphatase)